MFFHILEERLDGYGLDGMRKIQEKTVTVLLGIALILSALLVAKEAAVYTAARRVMVPQQSIEDKVCVVIDAGHGGKDPGKVGINGALEKDVNLEIAQKLQVFLEANDVKVIMTRKDDEGLYDADASNKKVQDMKRRMALIEEADPVLIVSIHQNSYQEEYVHGAQVFFYKGSSHGEALANTIQECLVETLKPDSERPVKANDSYYLLKKTDKPIVIVECGFLSNTKEAELLISPLYQEKVAWGIHMGILRYLNGMD